jgi:nucleotide-binding universal stress UspA family protein
MQPTEATMKRVLVPVDGSERAEAAVREVMRQAQAGAMEIHLINVQPRIFPEETLIGLPPEKIDTYYYDQGMKALASAEKLLRDAGVPFTSYRAVGPIAETIVAKAAELGCDGIVMSTRGHGKIAGMLLGSVSTKVLHLSPVPVTLVGENAKPDFSGRWQAT